MSSDDLIYYWREKSPLVADDIDSLVGAGATKLRDLKVVSSKTGLPSLDAHLGGGLPSGVVEVFGPESSGKTLLTGHFIAEAQRLGRMVFWCVTEKPDTAYMQNIGVDLEKLVAIWGPDPGAVADIIATCLSIEEGALLVLDSSSALYGVGDNWDDWVESMTYLMDVVDERMLPGCCLVVTSQVRRRRSFDRRTFLSSTESASRRFVDRFDARLELSRESVTEDTFDLIVHIVSNKLSPPGQFLDFESVKKGGPICVGRDLLKLGLKTGVLENRGPHYYLGDTRIGLGQDEAATALKDPKLFQEVIDRIAER